MLFGWIVTIIIDPQKLVHSSHILTHSLALDDPAVGDVSCCIHPPIASSLVQLSAVVPCSKRRQTNQSLLA